MIDLKWSSPTISFENHHMLLYTQLLVLHNIININHGVLARTTSNQSESVSANLASYWEENHEWLCSKGLGLLFTGKGPSSWKSQHLWMTETVTDVACSMMLTLQFSVVAVNSRRSRQGRSGLRAALRHALVSVSWVPHSELWSTQPLENSHFLWHQS